MKIQSKTARQRAAARRAVQKKPKTASKFFSRDDPEGSYTGVPADGGKPLQDADDL